MMTNQAAELEESTAVLFRRNPDSVPRRRRAGIDEPCGQVLTTNVGLRIPVGLTFDDWERAGRQLSGIVSSSSWWLGDWLVYGKDHYTDRYQRGIRAAGLQYQTLRNYAWVSRRFELHRRRVALTFQHHAELASLSVDEQDMWLDRAEQMTWTTKQLRNAIRMARADERQHGQQIEPTQQLAVPGNRLQWWHKAAEQSGTDFDEWVLATLDNAAEQALEEQRTGSGGTDRAITV
ncbi:LmbU family transcriptional regulator [Streptomyces sp. MBT62]|uniref:LmbU family transcriptional regulator n=1 Tax=Streptomyces sp. MBT62 TaxID=2800410 RepID=UPI0019092EEE|nr:LmbU family transcriptional regulator [Streptomyces sp. MBT62]MBK3562594.1 LmbU family transcriptional regulator [Streptomyces sp. MBT62]